MLCALQRQEAAKGGHTQFQHGAAVWLSGRGPDRARRGTTMKMPRIAPVLQKGVTRPQSHMTPLKAQEADIDGVMNSHRHIKLPEMQAAISGQARTPTYEPMAKHERQTRNRHEAPMGKRRDLFMTQGTKWRRTRKCIKCGKMRFMGQPEEKRRNPKTLIFSSSLCRCHGEQEMESWTPFGYLIIDDGEHL